MIKTRKILQIIAVILTVHLIGIKRLCAQDNQNVIEVANNSITNSELNTDLVKPLQVADSKYTTNIHIEEPVSKNLLVQTNSSPSQMPSATSSLNQSDNTVSNQGGMRQINSVSHLSDVQPTDSSPSQMLPTTNSLDQSDNTVNNQGGMRQINSVSKLSDVQPTDWAFQALQSLVERYGVIAGYPDSTFRGNRALTRYEFAAGLNAVMNRLNELVATGTADLVRKEDLATVQKLQSEFTVELATIRNRVDTLEVSTAKLESTQFSTTTKLDGEVVFGLASVFTGDKANGQPIDRNAIFSYRVRLNLNTSFNGRDLLTARLQGSNVTPFGSTNSGPTLTNEGRLEFDGDSANQVGLALLRYRLPLGPKTNFYIAGTGNGFVDLEASTQLNPYFDGGAVSLFALRNPIYNYTGGSGVGLKHFFNDKLELNLGYLSPGNNAAKPTQKNGIFNGVYGAMAQLIISPNRDSKIGLTYINSYSPSYYVRGQSLSAELNPDFIPYGTSTGSNLSNTNFNSPSIINAYGLSGTFKLYPHFAIGGWVGYANQRYIRKGDENVWNWAVTLAFPDVGKKGNLGGFLVGMEPKVTDIDSTLNNGRPDKDTSMHFEAFYRYQLTDNIQITPGVIWVTGPDFNKNNNDLVIGVVRTVFRF